MSWSISRLPISGFAANCYWLENGSEAWLIDPAAWPEKRPPTDAILQGIIVTHGHMDHILTADDWRDKYNVPLMIHKMDAHMLADSMANVSARFGRPLSWREPERILQSDEILQTGDGSILKIIHTPGHTSGGICILLVDEAGQDQALFTGDTIFSDSVGRTDLGGSDKDLMDSISKIKSLLNNNNGQMHVFPGHGPAISFADLCKSHPWLRSNSVE